jgi:hypothetical protein
VGTQEQQAEAHPGFIMVVVVLRIKTHLTMWQKPYQVMMGVTANLLSALLPGVAAVTELLEVQRHQQPKQVTVVLGQQTLYQERLFIMVAVVVGLLSTGLLERGVMAVEAREGQALVRRLVVQTGLVAVVVVVQPALMWPVVMGETVSL